MKIIIDIEGTKVKNVEVVTEETDGAIVCGVDLEGSVYSAWYNDSCIQWTKNPEYNKMFLLQQQRYFNDALKAKGHLFLNEVYDGLGIPRTSAGQIVGWIYDLNKPNGDNCVDFGLFHNQAADFINGYTNIVLLDFNVDGKIIDKI